MPRSQSTALVRTDPRRRIVLKIRDELVKLHGVLILAEQVTYEGINGPVESVDTLLDLLQHNPWFTWLHPISNLLVRIDYLLDDDAFEISQENVEHLMHEVVGLLQPSHEGDGFERAYYEALQRSPEVVLAHFQVRRLLPEAA